MTAFGLGVGVPSSAAPVAIVNTPENWAVLNGLYQFTPEVDNSGAGPLTYTVIQKPSWLAWNGTSLQGTPPGANEGLSELVILRVTNGDGEKSEVNYRIRVGRLVGPVASPPGGGSGQWTTGMPAAARAGGDALHVSGVVQAATIPMFWGLEPQGFGMKMDFVGTTDAGDSDYEEPAGFAFSPGEIGAWVAAESSPGAGLGIWQGTTHQPASIGGAEVLTILRAELRDEADAVSLPFTAATHLGLDGSVGALARIPAGGGLRVGMRLHAGEAYPAGTPALDWFNALPGKLAADRSVTRLESGFYWVNTVPRLTANNGLAASQGGTFLLTTAMLNAADTEDGAADLRISLGDGSSGGPPLHGTLEVNRGGNWNPLASGNAFTLEELAAGKVRYVNDGSYESSDGFQFRVLDAQDTVARDGNYTVFTFPIGVTLVNHPPVAADQSLGCGVGATVTGVLDFSDPDLGQLPQSISVSSAAAPTLGEFTITDPTTGAFSFTSNGEVGEQSIVWEVSDGEYSSSGTLWIRIENQAPVVQPLQLTGGNHGTLQADLVVNDPDLPAQAMTLAVVDPPRKGSVAISGLSLSYTPTPGRFGEDQFTVAATDSLGGVSDVQTVAVSLTPSSLGAEAVFVTSTIRDEEDRKEGAILRINPANGDVHTLATGLGQQTRGVLWSPGLGKLLVLLEAENEGNPILALVKVDPLSGAWGFDTLVSMNGSLAFPVTLAIDGPDHVLVANGPGGVLRIDLNSGDQEVMNLGLPQGAFVASALPIEGTSSIWVSDIGGLETPGDGQLYLCDRLAGTSSAPVALSPSGDPVGLFLVDSGHLAISRMGLPVENLELSPLSYTPLEGSPAAPWMFPLAIVRSGQMNAWLASDPFAGKVFRQDLGSGVITDVTPAGVDSPFGITLARGFGAIHILDGASDLVSGSSMDLGGVAVESGWRDRTLTLRNDGSAPLTLGLPTLSGPHAADFEWGALVATTLEPGDETTLTIRFKPDAAGTRSAHLEIASDDPAQAVFALDLSGTGAGAAELFDAATSAAGLAGAGAAASATPHGDGVANLLKYAFGLDLALPDVRVLGAGGSSGLPRVSLAEVSGTTVLRIEFLRRKASGLIYAPELSTDLGGFTAATATPVVSPVNDDWERVVVEQPCDPQQTTKCFARVRVTLP